MKRFAPVLLIAGIAAATACGSAGLEPAGGQAPVTAPSDEPDTSPARTARTARCGDDHATSTELARAQFAFVGAVAAVETGIHPWTTDPENPERTDVVETTPWVTFDVERWYTTDWGTTFSVWAPAFAIEVGDRVAVGGDAYHTEVGDFSGQSGEVEFCALLTQSESSPAAWDAFFGAGHPPSGDEPDNDVGTADPVATKVFGDTTGPCGATVLSNDADDDVELAAGASCFIREVEAGRPLVWDVVIATVEGDPVPSRYDFDGKTVVITTDDSFDSFGSGGVSELRCAAVRPTNWLPEGLDCTSHVGDGFRPDSLPFGS